jgi:uncharacterized protein YjiS (DUF1127 family)
MNSFVKSGPAKQAEDLNINQIMNAARQHRAEATQTALVSMGGAIKRLIKGVLAGLKQNRERRIALNTLLSLSDRDLRDVGLDRSIVLARFSTSDWPYSTKTNVANTDDAPRDVA